MIEDDLQSNMGCLMRATQLSRKFAAQKNEVFRGTSVRCVPRWLEAGEVPGRWPRRLVVGESPTEGQVSVACQGGKRVSWGVPNRGTSVRGVPRWFEAGEVTFGTFPWPLVQEPIVCRSRFSQSGWKCESRRAVGHRQPYGTGSSRQERLSGQGHAQGLRTRHLRVVQDIHEGAITHTPPCSPHASPLS